MEKKVLKIHKQMGHASKDQLLRLFENANFLNKDIRNLIKEVTVNCDICKRQKKAPARPVVSLPRAERWNQVVAMDLHEIVHGKLWYLHIIDQFTRYSNAIVVSRKSDASQAFLLNWISLFGRPAKIFSDNRGEFIGDDMYELCSAFDIKISTTPSYSPWSNGVVERHNQMLTTMAQKIRTDMQCDWKTAVAWAVCAKNHLINHNGYSPAQLVFGESGLFPSIINDGLPALEKIPSSNIGLHICSSLCSKSIHGS